MPIVPTANCLYSRSLSATIKPLITSKNTQINHILIINGCSLLGHSVSLNMTIKIIMGI